MTPLSSSESVSVSKLTDNKISPLVKSELQDSTEERMRISTLNKEHFTSIRKNITSDYESCNESPSSSDHSDNIPTADDFSGSPPKKMIGRTVDTSVAVQIAHVVRIYMC